MIDVDTMSVLINPAAREVFKQVLKMRRVRFSDLTKRLNPAVDPDQAKTALEGLQIAGLVDKSGSEIDDFSTYYVTADGLTAARKTEL